MWPSALRIIDANLNRAREAMRVLEDFARFALDDAAASRALKQMRHDLAAAASVWPKAALLAARDTIGDVGTRISTAGEKRRRSAADIVAAAAKRLSEALRVIEEYAKVVNPEAGAAVEHIRYRAYEIERRLVPAAEIASSAPSGRSAFACHALGAGAAAVSAVRGSRRPLFAVRTACRAGARGGGVGLYVLITESLCRRSWYWTAAEAIAGGADCIQLREKGLDDAELLSRARRLVKLCHRHGIPCIINDRPDIARLAGADGVHVGQTDMSVAEARAILGPEGFVGKSTHTVAQFRAALREEPDYVAIGPMYETATKPQRYVPGPAILPKLHRILDAWLDRPRPADLGRVVPSCVMPLVAIGGITMERLQPILAAGVRTIAVSSAVVGAGNPRSAARALKRRLLRVEKEKRA